MTKATKKYTIFMVIDSNTWFALGKQFMLFLIYNM